jgi:hypothetical protein
MIRKVEQVRIWVDNFRASMKRKKAGEDKQSEPNDTVKLKKKGNQCLIVMEYHNIVL